MSTGQRDNEWATEKSILHSAMDFGAMQRTWYYHVLCIAPKSPGTVGLHDEELRKK